MTIDNNLLADSYDAAADYIEQHGWHQQELAPGVRGHDIDEIVALIQRDQPPACAMGAGYGVGLKNGQYVQGTGRFAKIDVHIDWIPPLSQESGMFITDWNDEPERTKEEVVDLLRMTALKVRMGNIGDNPREYEFEPMPASEPVVEPAAPQPVKEPQPA